MEKTALRGSILGGIQQCVEGPQCVFWSQRQEISTNCSPWPDQLRQQSLAKDRPRTSTCPKESVSRVEASHSHPMFLKRKRSFSKGCQSLSSARLESIHQRHGPYPTKAPNSSCRSVIDLTRVVTDRFSRRATWSIIRLVKHTNGVWLSQKRLLSVLTVNTVSL